MERIAVSTWALDRWIAESFADSPGEPNGAFGVGMGRIGSLPRALAGNGYRRVEICHFHLPPSEGARLSLAEGLTERGIELQTLLIDAGDVTDPEFGERDEAWIAKWIDKAIVMGFRQARVVAGKQPWSEESRDRSVAALGRLADSAGDRISLVIENWFDLLQTPAHVHDLLDRLDGRVGLNGDFGNWSGPDKYERLAGIMGRAVACHAKCDSNEAYHVDREDYERCLRLSEEAGYTGPYTLVHGAGLDFPWDFLRHQIGIIEATVGQK